MATTTPPAPDHGKAAPHPVPRWAVIGIFLLMAFGAITLARSFLVPLSLGILLFFVFSPICRFLARGLIPKALSAAIITLGLLIGLMVAVFALSVPITDMVDNAPTIFDRLQYKVQAVRGSVENIRDAADKFQELSSGGDGDGGEGGAGGEGDQPVAAPPQSGTGILTQIATTAPALIGQFVFTLVLLYFLLAGGDMLYRRIVESFSRIHDKRRALDAMYEIERSLGSYLGAITLINACLGVAVGTAMWFWEMPSPALFGVGAFAFNFIPYIGALGGVALATVVALVTKIGLVTPLLVGATYLVLTSMEGQFVTPYFVSYRLRLNAVVVFLAVALWAWLWSVMGMIVAVPMLVVLRVLCIHVPALSGLGNFLSGDAPADPEFDGEAAAARDRAAE